MDDHQHHDNAIQGVSREYKEIFKNSDQGIYIYLDDNHKICNQKFATLLGYESPEEWANVNESFPDAFVAEKSQETLIDTYKKAIEQSVGSQISVTWKKKSGGTIATKVILVPVSHQGHLFALHFVS